MPSVTTRFPPHLHERFLQECERRDMSPSDFIRKAVEAMMDHIDSPHFVPSNAPQITKADFERALAPPRGVRGFAATDGAPLLPAGPKADLDKKAPRK